MSISCVSATWRDSEQPCSHYSQPQQRVEHRKNPLSPVLLRWSGNGSSWTCLLPHLLEPEFYFLWPCTLVAGTPNPGSELSSPTLPLLVKYTSTVSSFWGCMRGWWELCNPYDSQWSFWRHWCSVLFYCPRKHWLQKKKKCCFWSFCPCSVQHL